MVVRISGCPSLDMKNKMFLTKEERSFGCNSPVRKLIASNSKLIIQGIRHSKTTSIAINSGDKSDGLIDITDNNPVLTKFEYYYDVYINMKKYESYENKSLNYANINNVYGIYYVIESTWENAKPIDLYENVIYYDILNKNTMTIVELREGPCVVTSTNDILEVYYFDNYTE